MVKALQIKDFPEYYVTDMGDVYSRIYHPIQNPGTRIRKVNPYTNRYGYSQVTLCKDGKHYTKRVHRLIAEHFIPNPDNKPQVNHKNGIRTDNRVENLEWCSGSENIQHAYRVLHRRSSMGMLGKFGKLHPNSKVIQQIQDGKVIAEYYGSGEASRATGIVARNIRSVCEGKREFAGGYKWRYKNNT